MDFGTDLALERRELLKKNISSGIKQIKRINGKCEITEIKITDRDGEKKIGKPMGSYITLEVAPFSSGNEFADGCPEALSDEIKNLIPPQGDVLVVGLGNKAMTADALGPDCADRIFATRHIGKELAKSIGLDNLRPVASVTPGVLGRTGIEASEIIRGIAEIINPSCVIAIDALAARNIKRLGTTVQLCDSGISPGSGIGNTRKEISRKTLGIPVISIGVPTVINAYTVAQNVLEASGSNAEIPSKNNFSEYFVASREADLITERASKLIALSINCALQPELSKDEILALM